MIEQTTLALATAMLASGTGLTYLLIPSKARQEPHKPTEGHETPDGHLYFMTMMNERVTALSNRVSNLEKGQAHMKVALDERADAVKLKTESRFDWSELAKRNWPKNPEAMRDQYLQQWPLFIDTAIDINSKPRPTPPPVIEIGDTHKPRGVLQWEHHKTSWYSGEYIIGENKRGVLTLWYRGTVIATAIKGLKFTLQLDQLQIIAGTDHYARRTTINKGKKL